MIQTALTNLRFVQNRIYENLPKAVGVAGLDSLLHEATVRNLYSVVGAMGAANPALTTERRNENARTESLALSIRAFWSLRRRKSAKYRGEPADTPGIVDSPAVYGSESGLGLLLKN